MEIDANAKTSDGKSVLEGVQQWLGENGVFPPSRTAIAAPNSVSSSSDAEALRLSLDLSRGGFAAPVAASTVAHPNAAQTARSRARLQQ